MTNENLEIEMNIRGLLELSKKQQRNIRIMAWIWNCFIIEHLNGPWIHDIDFKTQKSDSILLDGYTS